MTKKLIKPWQTCTCPICGKDFFPGDCAIVNSNKDVIRPAQKGVFSRAFVTQLQGRNLVRQGAMRLCPHCDSPLPDNIESAKSYTIAIVGDLTSGKSLYITSCIHQLLQDHASQMIGCSTIIGLGDTDKRFYEEYFEPTYLKRQKLVQPGAPSGQPYKPLIYELVFPDRPTVNLLFYDASGEDIQNTANMKQYSHFIFNAAAIIFLADPWQMPKIVDTLPNILKPRYNTAGCHLASVGSRYANV